MPRVKSLTYFFLLPFLLQLNLVLAQNKSTNIQVQENRKFYIHKIEKGQSLYAISKLYGVSVEDLYNYNPELKQAVKAGQEIRIPFQTVNAEKTPGVSTQMDTAKYITHKLLKGETIYSICRKYNITERQLAAYNPGLSQGLKEGQVIVVGEKVKPKPAVKSGAASKAAPAPKNTMVDSSLFKPVSKTRKETYNVALALPFKLDQTLNLDLNAILRSGAAFPAVPALATDFYLGFRLAIDSLAAKDFNVNLELYDIDDKDSAGLMRFTNEAKFKDHDFIFGPLYANGFKSIAKKAKEFHIPIVSPITQQNKILYNNIYISKTNPSQFTLLEGLADYCMDSLMKEKCNVLLVASSDKDKKDANFVSAYRKYFTERMKGLDRPNKDTLRLVKGIEGVKAAYVPNVKNIVIHLSTNQVLISDFITQLALFKKDKDLVFCGWESNSTNDNIDQEYLNDLNYTFPYQFNLIDSCNAEALVKRYLYLQGTSPGEYFFMGFEVAYYYLKNLKEHGPEFAHKLDQYPMDMKHMRFKFSRPDLSTGFDNRGLYIYKYNNYQLHKTGWR
ncbi:MAG: LysM peptidoglycan-binding domain-containing protein [Bacteroidia bacterium]|nr:LysM peptidoglycan-binding domain-containing protein [Bacteroidia bacterium]